MAVQFSMTPARVQFDGGKFDSDNRYVLAVTTGAVSTVVKGQSLKHTSGTQYFLSWTFNSGDYTLSASPGTNVPAPAFAAASTLVKM